MFAARSERPIYGATSVLFTLVVDLTVLSFIVWMMIVNWPMDSTFTLIWLLFGIACMVVMTPFLVFVTWLTMIGMLDSHFVLDTDGVRSMWKDRVLGEVRFDRDTFVEVEVACLPERNVVSGFWFHKGWWRMDFTLSQYDVERTWPVIKAAAWKHRMPLGKEIERLLKRDVD